jgi:hypothetical protein
MKKTHPTWDLMRPNKNEKYGDFKFEEYYQRILDSNEFNHISRTIFEQWIYYFHQDHNTLKNYGWLNYANVEFNICEWGLIKLEKVNIIEEYKDYYFDRSSYSDFNQFCCIPEDLKNWKEKGTWRVPPIIIDVTSLRKSVPSGVN